MLKDFAKKLFTLLNIPSASVIRCMQWSVIDNFFKFTDDDIVLDIGCGDRSLVAEIAIRNKISCQINAIDFSYSALIDAQQLTSLYHIDFVNGDASYLPYKSGSVDVILMSSLLQMVPNPDTLLSECKRVLKNYGMITLSVPSDYVFIKNIYEKKPSLLARLIMKLMKMPSGYEQFLIDLNQMHKVGGKGYYSLVEIKEMLEEANFNIVMKCYSPGLVGSLVWEVGVMLSHRFKSSFPKAAMFLLFPITLVDRLVPASDSLMGCELIVKCIKAD